MDSMVLVLDYLLRGCNVDGAMWLVVVVAAAASNVAVCFGRWIGRCSRPGGGGQHF